MKANSRIEWRKITIKDYETLFDWWIDWGWEKPPTLEMLSNYGYIVSKDGVDMYAGFLYFTGSSMAWLEFVVCNKNATPEQRRGCLDKLIEVVTIIAKDKCAKSIFTSTNNPAFVNSLMKLDFTKGDIGVTQLIKNI